MGLDSVELVISFEEAFGIQLKDEEVTDTRTPRMVIDLIFSKLEMAEKSICRSQRAFYKIRRILMETLGLERNSITPDTRFRDYIPKSQEERVWEQIRAVLSPRSWPGLVRPRWLFLSLTTMGLSIFFVTVLLAVRSSSDIGLSILRGTLLTIAFGVVAGMLTRPIRTCIPAQFACIRDMIPYAITSCRMTGWTREDVAAIVKRLTMEQLGLEESEYTEDSRFVEDFHIDS